MNYSRVLSPLASTSKHIEQAIKLIDDHKCYSNRIRASEVVLGVRSDILA